MTQPHHQPAPAFTPDTSQDAQQRSAAALEYMAAMLVRIDAKLGEIQSAIGFPGSQGFPIKTALDDLKKALTARPRP